MALYSQFIFACLFISSQLWTPDFVPDHHPACPYCSGCGLLQDNIVFHDGEVLQQHPEILQSH